MMCDYIAIDGSTRSFNLDHAIDFVGGHSTKRNGWSGLICYASKINSFIELRDSNQNARGHCISEAEEVPQEYIQSAYKISSEQISSFLTKPNEWQFIDYR